MNTWLLNEILLSGNIQPHRLVLHDNICKREKFLKKIMHTPTHYFFIILPFWKGFHKNKHYSSTSWEDVLVGSEDEHFFKKTKALFSFKLFELFGRSKAPWFKGYKWNGSLGGSFREPTVEKSRRSQVLNSFLKTYFILEPNYVTYTLRDSTHEIGG